MEQLKAVKHEQIRTIDETNQENDGVAPSTSSHNCAKQTDEEKHFDGKSLYKQFSYHEYLSPLWVDTKHC